MQTTEDQDMYSGPPVVSVSDSYKPGIRMGKKTHQKTHQSPFQLPEKSLFLFTAEEKEHRREEMHRYLALPAHEKMSFMGRMKVKQRAVRREQGDEEDEEEEEGNTMRLVQGNPAMRMAMIKRENIKKESMQDFLSKRREMFLQEYSVMVKREEFRRLETAIGEEEQRMQWAEQLLDQDQLLFVKFLKENNQNSVEAIQIAEKETKCKLEKMAEIKKLTTEMVTIKSDISKKEEMLKEYQMYKDFLFKLSPPEWREVQLAKAKATPLDQEAAAVRHREKDSGNKAVGPKRGSLDRKVSGHVRKLPSIRDPRLSSSQRAKSSTCSSAKLIPASNPSSDGSEYEEEPELYFTNPQQLLDLLTELEEQNLTLIQNSRETDEALEELQHATNTSKKKMERDTEQLSIQIDTMSQTIATEKERAAELELKARLYNFGKSKSVDEDHMLHALGRKVDEVYRCCVGDNMKANLSTLQMLVVVESHLLQLLENMDNIPRDTLDKVQKMKDRERRMRQRDQKLQLQKEHQEERLKKAMERAQADIQKTNGRRLMARSKPVARKIKYSNVNNVSEQEELQAYFFT